MSTELYPGIAFSPQAALADNIGAADTIIKVTDVSVFPDAPNLATIGTDEEGETIFYAAKTADALSGCVRGVEGTAKAWSAGEIIGRNWTAKDHKDLIAAVLEAQGTATGAQSAAKTAQATADTASAALSTKQDKLTGTPGQVVGFGADGSAAAVPGWSSLNLLDNPDFSINQRGFDSDNWKSGYGPDRWSSMGPGSLSYHGKEIVCRTQQLCQKFEKGVIQKGTYTASALCTSNIDVTLGYWGGSAIAKTSKNYNNGFASVTITLDSADTERPGYIYLKTTGSGESLSYVKLELGPVQTLAHQDASGNWVLNDPPPNKALELLRCQRYYYQSIGSLTKFQHLGIMQVATENVRLASVDFPVRMRATPAVTIYTASSASYGAVDAVTEWTSGSKVPGVVAVYKGPDRFVAGLANITQETKFVPGKGYFFNYTASADL